MVTSTQDVGHLRMALPNGCLKPSSSGDMPEMNHDSRGIRWCVVGASDQGSGGRLDIGLLCLGAK